MNEPACTERLTIATTPELQDAIKRAAASRNMTIADLVRTTVGEALIQQGQPIPSHHLRLGRFVSPFGTRPR